MKSHSTRSAQPSSAGHAALIDDKGREIPITEQMIQQACRTLARQAPWPQQRTASR